MNIGSLVQDQHRHAFLLGVPSVQVGINTIVYLRRLMSLID